MVRYPLWESRETRGGAVSTSESSVNKLLLPKLLALRFRGGGGGGLLSEAGRPLAPWSAASFISPSLAFRLLRLLCPGISFRIPLLPDLLLPSRLGLDWALPFLKGGLSKVRESMES